MTPDQHPCGLSERRHQVHRDTGVKCRCDEPGREREEDHCEQDKQVEAQEELIDPRELLGQGGVAANPNTPSLNPSIRFLLRTRGPRGVSESDGTDCLLHADWQAVVPRGARPRWRLPWHA